MLKNMESNLGIVTGSLNFIKFPEGNNIKFWQDHKNKESIPSNLNFYPRDEIGGSIAFIANGYGILKGNKWNLVGEYGSGAIYITNEDLDLGILTWCRENFI